MDPDQLVGLIVGCAAICAMFVFAWAADVFMQRYKREIAYLKAWLWWHFWFQALPLFGLGAGIHWAMKHSDEWQSLVVMGFLALRMLDILYVVSVEFLAWVNTPGARRDRSEEPCFDA